MRVFLTFVLAGAAFACSPAPTDERREPPAVEPAAFAAEFAEWRREQDAMLRDPRESSLAYAGLWPLGEGRTTFGSDPSMAVRLPASAPAFGGTVVRRGAVVEIEAPPGGTITLDDGTVLRVPTRAASDRQHGTTVIAMGALQLVVHEESGPSFWLRLIDPGDRRLREFAGVPTYEPDMSWRVAAKFEPFSEPRLIEIPDVTGGMQRATAPGMLRFYAGGATYRLMAMTTGNRERWSVPFQDATNRTDTYGGGRYLTVPVPDAAGWTVIDFNRARNPPCAYSAFTVCELPPSSNRLALAITAGQKRPAD